MRRLLPLTLLALTPLLSAEEKPAAKPNTLTPQQAREGWLLLFDGETTFGWKVEGEAKVKDGVLILGGTKATKAEPTVRLGSYSVSLETDWRGERVPTILHGLLPIPLPTGSPKSSQGAFTQNSTSCWTRSGPTPPVRFEIPAGTTVLVRNVRVRPDLTEKLFNGKNLDGWKVFEGKGKKSKYAVTKEGSLNVKDGPGDIQTEKLFDDFVLQLECKSNGRHLNSGVFFRCLPGQYQQGYEAQVRNEFGDKPRKYVVEDYDPKTHKLVEKRTVLSPAVDYGTGAIYRRVPARRGVAKDGEWFTMTVLARGRHLATWVNGVQVADWADNRPERGNARQGYYAKAGAVSIQGHDPTTDLDFRNLRIAPLKR